MKIEIEKPVVPQFVADAITDVVRCGGTLSTLYSVAFDHPLHDWLYEDEYIRNEREMLLATVFMYGCEVEPPLFYAKVKGWELLDEIEGYWNWRPVVNGFCISSKEEIGSRLTNMSKHEWSLLGINDTNADFEEVE